MTLPIFIDNIAFYLQKTGGVTVVWKELLLRLIKRYPETVSLFYKNPPTNIFYDSIKDNFRIRYLPLYNLTIQRYFPVSLKNISRPFIFHSTYYRYSTNHKAINITTVHDFTYEYYTTGLVKKIHCWQKYKAIRHSQFVICISENTKKDLFKFLPDIDQDKVRVIYNGVSDDYYPIQTWNRNIIPFEKNDYLLFVGARSSYKNFDFLVTSLRGTEYKLVVVGAELSKTEIELLKCNLKDNYYYAGRLSNTDLNNLYNGAYAFVYPSSYEGFGIPILEAQRAGCPVIAYNASSIPEVIGDTPLLMNNLTTDELLGKLSLLKDINKRQDIIQKGYINAMKFSWDKSFEKLMEVYNEAECLLL